MNYQKLTFENIMQDKILYFDKEVESACHDICNTLKIDNMPDYNSNYFYELIDAKFEKKEIIEELKLDLNDLIFEPKNIDKFKNNKHNVLFVCSGKVLKGIVHFADYNRNIVLKRIQDDVLNFELNLREFLVLNGKTIKDVIKYYEFSILKERRVRNLNHFKRRLSFFKNKENEINSLGEFQLCELSDLMDYCNSTFSYNIFKFENHKDFDSKIGSQIIGSLRNIVMHGKNPIEKDIDTSIFSIESLIKFQKSLEILKYYNSRLEELIYSNEDYQLSVKLENQNKLKIIHEHHPRALKYFIGY
jgi:hypothetical protein